MPPNDNRLYPKLGLHGKVAHEIGRRIVAGALAEGTLLPPEAELATEFSVSRQAVREALKVLAAKGLVASRRRTGTRVLPRASWNLLDPDILAWYTPERIPAQLLADLIEVRRLIEPAAAELAALRGEKNAKDGIFAALEEMRRAATDALAFREADARFHAAVFMASGNQIIERLSDIIGPMLRASFMVQDQARGMQPAAAVIPAHESIYDAIVAGNGTSARHEMEALLSRASREVAAIVAGH
ncbi:MAG TPA: FadR/GntR family transcriptional regulator [Bauldia sp.]|nr:FadR/GntR family transcriptional regulator [Bauldia sp.]